MSKIIISTDFADKDIKTTMVFKVHPNGTIEVMSDKQENNKYSIRRKSDAQRIVEEQEVMEFVRKHYPNATLREIHNSLSPHTTFKITAEDSKGTLTLSNGFTVHQAWSNAKVNIEKELAEKSKQAEQELFKAIIDKRKPLSQLVEKTIKERYLSHQFYPDIIILHPMDKDRLDGEITHNDVINSTMSKIYFGELNIELKVLSSDQVKVGEIIVR